MSLINSVYNRILRPYLPHKISVHNGVPVRGIVHLLDQTFRFPDYEEQLVQSIREVVRYGDNVVLVGGGIGVSTVVAAQRTVEKNSVTTYEANPRQVETVKQTIKLNQVDNRCSVHHGIVGENVGVYGDPGDANLIEPPELPQCDILVLDCEGAEKGIIESLAVRPQTIIVETHGFLNVPETAVRESLSNIGYTVTERKVEDSENGVIILTAISK